MTIDQQLTWIQGEMASLRERPEAWAQRKMKVLEAIHETVRKARQSSAMTSAMTGKAIGAS